ncbi:hypothetical protein AVEN_214426-1, partial [Araneus ventricosus]
FSKWKLEKEIQTVKITRKLSIQEARKIVLDRTPEPNDSYTAALKATKTPDTHIEQRQMEHFLSQQKLKFQSLENEETITVKLSDWLDLLDAHKRSLENEQTKDKKQEFFKPVTYNKRKNKDFANTAKTDPKVKKPFKTKLKNKESESAIQV